MKREAPYTRLKRIAQEALVERDHPSRRDMFRFPKDQVRSGEAWSMNDVAERVAAADQIGWDVQMKLRDGDLIIQYVKRPGTMPWELT